MNDKETTTNKWMEELSSPPFSLIPGALLLATSQNEFIETIKSGGVGSVIIPVVGCYFLTMIVYAFVTVVASHMLSAIPKLGKVVRIRWLIKASAQILAFFIGFILWRMVLNAV